MLLWMPGLFGYSVWYMYMCDAGANSGECW